MKRVVPMTCPACAEPMNITELTCPDCQARVQGDFLTPGLFRLNPEQLQFVEVFVRCRGNIKEVERDLKISYPTVRARLDQAIHSMGYTVTSQQAEAEESQISDALTALESGELSYEDVLETIREGKLKR